MFNNKLIETYRAAIIDCKKNIKWYSTVIKQKRHELAECSETGVNRIGIAAELGYLKRKRKQCDKKLSYYQNMVKSMSEKYRAYKISGSMDNENFTIILKGQGVIPIVERSSFCKVSGSNDLINWNLLFAKDRYEFNENYNLDIIKKSLSKESFKQLKIIGDEYETGMVCKS